MISSRTSPIHALLFGLSEDLAGELLAPLANFCSRIQSVDESTRHDSVFASEPSARIIFCGADTEIVTKLRAANPQSPIVVVSRHPEISDWLDSIEAGATDYCAAPFETSQVEWIVETSMRSVQTIAAA
jgi:DNA-binding NarL/FixJ family response regulator